MFVLLNSFFWQINHQFLREEQQLIYGAETFNVNFGIAQKIRGFKFTCDKAKLVETLNATHHAIYNRIDEFFKSNYGKRWFNSIVSHEIFQTNTSVDEN